jgi:hypothetical protein
MDKQPYNDLGKEMSDPEAIQVWQSFASAGGNDKDRMVSVSTWLLAFSGAIIGFSVTEGFRSGNYKAVAVLAILGMIVSILAGCVTLMYGGYAKRNWAMADSIAELKGWYDLVPGKRSRVSVHLEEKLQTRTPIWPANWADKLSKTEDPLQKLAPIFRWFFWFAVGSFILQMALFAGALIKA